MLMPEFRVANRALPVPLGQSEEDLAKRVLEYFNSNNMVIPFTASGRLTSRGLCICFDARCAQARDAGDVMSAARLGAGPWHLAMLSAGLLAMEIAVGDHDRSPCYAARTLAVDQRHVARAYELLSFLHESRAQWQLSKQVALTANHEERRFVQEATRRAAAAAPAGVHLPASQFDAWVHSRIEAVVAGQPPQGAV